MGHVRQDVLKCRTWTAIPIQPYLVLIHTIFVPITLITTKTNSFVNRIVTL